MKQHSDRKPIELTALVGPGSSLLVLSDRRQVNLMRVRIEIESMVVGASPFAGIVSPAGTRCLGLISSTAEQHAYQHGGRDLMDGQAYAITEPFPMLTDPASWQSLAYLLKRTYAGEVGFVTLKAPALPKRSDQWCSYLSQLAESFGGFGAGLIVLAECADTEQLDALPSGYSNALLVSHAEPDQQGTAFGVRAHAGSLLAFLGYRPQLIQLINLPDGSVERKSQPMTSPSRLTRHLMALHRQGKSLQAIADEAGINKSTVYRRLESVDSA